MKLYHFYQKIKGMTAIALLAPASALFFSGCTDFLEVEPRDLIVLENFWNEKADVDNIVSGCYSAFQSRDCISRMIIWGEARSENMAPGTNTTNDANLLNLLNENITAKNSYTNWLRFYDVINRCSTVIKYAPKVASIDPGYTESELNATIAEMTALRSLSYFYLIRTFRDVPFSREAYTDDDQQMMLPATPFNQVLDSLIYDLESVKDMAVERYPSITPLYQTGRITKDAIHAMLCEMYLWKQDYDNCIKYADLVIASKRKIADEIEKMSRTTSSQSGESDTRTNGYPLITDQYSTTTFGNAYRYMYASDIESASSLTNQEVIFQLVFDDYSNNMPKNAVLNDFYGTQSSPQGWLKPSDYIVEDIAKTSGRTVFEDKNKKMDARMYEFINTSSSNPSINKYTRRNTYVNGSTSNPEAEYGDLWSDGDNRSNWIIYRLADIMLLKAEAITQKLREGSDQETINYNEPYIAQAFSLINAVNKRSVCQTTLTDTLVAGDYVTKVQIEDLVLRERQRELMFEGKRWYDLVRLSRRQGSTSTLVQSALKKVTTGSGLISNKLSKMDAMYWPYNYEEMKVNTYLVQNPAFSSGETSSYESSK